MEFTTIIRVWSEIHRILKEMSKSGFIMSDLASAILFEALRNEGIVASALTYWFKVPYEEALTMAKKSKKMVEALEEKLEKMREEDEVMARVT